MIYAYTGGGTSDTCLYRGLAEEFMLIQGWVRADMLIQASGEGRYASGGGGARIRMGGWFGVRVWKVVVDGMAKGGFV